MKDLNVFARSTFTLISLVFFGSLTTGVMPEHSPLLTFLAGGLGGVFFMSLLFLSARLFNFSIRNFNSMALGLLFGWFFGHTLLLSLSELAAFLDIPLTTHFMAAIQGMVYIASCYMGVILTIQASNELQICLPFFKFDTTDRKKKDILLDPALLSDPRLFDLAKSGLLDQHLIIPGFALNELNDNTECDEEGKNKTQTALDTLKKLKDLDGLNCRLDTYDFIEPLETYVKLVRLARKLNANILTADISKIQQSEIDGPKVININLLSQALKPLTSAGEFILIKIQRYGKEPRQGVGYLDDGTMVVVNGGAAYIGKTIKVVVLSIKPTTSGRMIFCNTLDEECPYQSEGSIPTLESANSHYISA